MRHFAFLDDADRARLFHLAPEAVDPAGPADLLSVALGATLYSPATRPKLSEDIARRAAQGTSSVVVCLEDSVADADLPAAERNAVRQLVRLAESTHAAERPLVFVRVRTPEQIGAVVDALGSAAEVLSGFVLPKFTAASAPSLVEVVTASERLGRRLYAMPVLESREIAYVETRRPALLAARDLVERHREHVLAVRIGATDLSAPYGLRRSREHTAYDVALLGQCIADIVNVFGRADSGFVVTGPVWEYFPSSERIFKPLLRETPFVAPGERRLRAELLARAMDGLLREVTLDRANGLQGKSVIHPSHVAAVNALSVVPHEEYLDALDVLGTEAGGGVASSTYRNKMNESKPHTAWARRTQLRARVFGVAREDATFVDLLAASLHQ